MHYWLDTLLSPAEISLTPSRQLKKKLTGMRLVLFRGPLGFGQEQHAHWWAAQQLPPGSPVLVVTGGSIEGTNALIDLLHDHLQPNDPALLIVRRAQDLAHQLANRQFQLALRRFPKLHIALLAHHSSDVEIELLIDSPVNATLVQPTDLVSNEVPDPTGLQSWPGLARIVALATESGKAFDWQLIEAFSWQLLNQFPAEDRTLLASAALPRELTPEIERHLFADTASRKRIKTYLDSGISSREGQLPHVIRRAFLAWLAQNDPELLRTQARSYLTYCLASEDAADGLTALAILRNPPEMTGFLVNHWQAAVTTQPQLVTTILQHRSAFESHPLLDELAQRLCEAKRLRRTDAPLEANVIFLGSPEEPPQYPLETLAFSPDLSAADVMTMQWAMAEMSEEDYGAACQAVLSCLAEPKPALGEAQVLTFAGCLAAISGNPRRALELVDRLDQLRLPEPIAAGFPGASSVIKRFALMDMLETELPPCTLPTEPWLLPAGWLLMALETLTTAKRHLYLGEVADARNTALALHQEMHDHFGAGHVGSIFANTILSLVSLLSSNINHKWDWALPVGTFGLEKPSIKAIRFLLAGDAESAVRVTCENPLASTGNIRFEMHRLFVHALAQQEQGDCHAAAAAIREALVLKQQTGLAYEFAFLPTDFVGKVAAQVPELTKLRAEIVTPRWEIAELSLTKRLGLTAAELEVLRLLATSNTFAQIAALRFTTASTVRSQARTIYRKLDTSCREETVERAINLGIIHPSPVFRPFTP